MKKILLLLFLSLIFGQTDNIGSQTFDLTAEQVFHSGRGKVFSDGTYLFKSHTNRTTVDTSGLFITDTTVGAATGSQLLQGGLIITSSAADLNILKDFTNDGYTVVIDSSGYLLNVPRTVYGWSHNLTFSVTDYNTIAWTSGELYFANLDTFEIINGNTANMTAPTWIYFDENISETGLRLTSTAGNAVGLGRIIVCVAANNADTDKDAVFQVFGGVGGGITIFADMIAANTITANELATNTITTNELNFTAVEDDNVIAFINASSEGLFITGDRIQITGATTFATGYNSSDGSVVIYQISAPGTRPSGDALENGDSWVDTTAAQGNIPRIWTGSEWRVAYTYIHGGYIKTGTVETDRLDVDDIFAQTITATGTITGGIFQTSSSGQRVIIDGSNNELRFYDSGGIQRILFHSSVGTGSYAGIFVDGGTINVEPIENAATGFALEASKINIDNTKNLFGFKTNFATDNSDIAYGAGSAIIGFSSRLKVDGGSLDVTGLIAGVSGTTSGAVWGIRTSGRDGGIYASSSGGYAGYFATGNVKIENNLEVTGTITGNNVTFNSVTAPTLNVTALIAITERGAAPAAAAGIGKLWVKNTTPNELWFTNDAGTSFKIY